MRTRGIWSDQWFFYLTTALLLGAVVLRSILSYDKPILFQALAMLAVWLLLFLAVERFVPGRSMFFWVYLTLQTLLILALLFLPGPADSYAALFFVLSMQVVQRAGLRAGAGWIGLFVLLPIVPFTQIFGVANGTANVLVNAAGDIIFAVYAHAAARARLARTDNLALAQELQEKNHQLQLYSEQLERLAALRERQRLARDLHDSVTQTVFSMTLTTQSALLLLDREPGRVGEQLDRLNQLAHSALAEMRVLVSKLDQEQVAEGGLAAMLHEHLTQRRLENLEVSLQVTGSTRLKLAEELGLFRIAQEALNNVVKHAQTNRAWVRVCLEKPPWMQVEDRGCGFDGKPTEESGGVGLKSMRERADEIGWNMQVDTRPGAGTRIRVEKRSA
jgi:signal transduction histidine kinase